MKKYALTFLCLLLTGMIVAGCSTVKNTSSLLETAGADSSEEVSVQSVEQTTSPAKESTTTSHSSTSSRAESLSSVSLSSANSKTTPTYSKISTTAISSLTNAQIIQIIEESHGIDLPASIQLLPGGIIDFMFDQSDDYIFIREIGFFTVKAVFDEEEADAFLTSLNNDSEWQIRDEQYLQKIYPMTEWVYEVEHPEGFTYYEKRTRIAYSSSSDQTLPATVAILLVPDSENHSYTFITRGVTYNHTNYVGKVEIQ